MLSVAVGVVEVDVFVDLGIQRDQQALQARIARFTPRMLLITNEDNFSNISLVQ